MTRCQTPLTLVTRTLFSRTRALRARALGATLRKSAEEKKSGLAIVEKMPACREAARPRGEPVMGG